MKWLGFILCLSSVLAWAEDRALSPFEQGNQAFDEGRFAEAWDHYSVQLESGNVSPPLHFNLATAALHNGHLGRAIYHLRIAQTLKPRDSDITQNLKIARDEVHNGTPPKAGTWHRLTGFLNADEWALLAAPLLTGWLLWLALIYWQPEARPKAAVFRPILGVLALALMAVALLAWKSEANNDWGVISGETEVRFGPVEQSPDQFKWFDGTEVQISRRHQDWFLARDVTGRQGWVHADVLLTPKG